MPTSITPHFLSPELWKSAASDCFRLFMFFAHDFSQTSETVCFILDLLFWLAGAVVSSRFVIIKAFKQVKIHILDMCLEKDSSHKSHISLKYKVSLSSNIKRAFHLVQYIPLFPIKIQEKIVAGDGG
uniref:Uncharacterized protein n=1 Tax=Micrurus paraensis TaxID=1970185 RepID=A0A2D4L8J7_9SAUR